MTEQEAEDTVHAELFHQQLIEEQIKIQDQKDNSSDKPARLRPLATKCPANWAVWAKSGDDNHLGPIQSLAGRIGVRP